MQKLLRERASRPAAAPAAPDRIEAESSLDAETRGPRHPRPRRAPHTPRHASGADHGLRRPQPPAPADAGPMPSGRHAMRLHVRALLVALAIIACASGARAQDYSAVVVFGDSLSDSGNVAQLLPLVPPGSSFTTNPDPVWAELVAQTFSAPGINSLAGGTNYAVGGACVNPDLPCLVTVPGVGEIRLPGIDEQIALHVGSRPDGGGRSRRPLRPMGREQRPRRYPRGRPDACAGCSAGQSRGRHRGDGATLRTRDQRLQDAGARHIVVFNLPIQARRHLPRVSPIHSFRRR